MHQESITKFRNKELIHHADTSQIYRLPDQRLLKIASMDFLEACEELGTSYALKINSKVAQNIPEIVSPLTAIYYNNLCLGYTMKEISGINLTDYDKKFTLKERADLKQYFNLYSKIERVVKKANVAGIVMPDLCTTENIYILPNKDIRFIDYDGMQLGKNDKTIVMSSSLGDILKYITSSKYNDGTYHFTTELDKTSLTMLLFLLVFNIDLTKIGTYDPYKGKKITITDIFNKLGIKDEIFLNKIAANISFDKKGTYLEDELYKLMNDYDMLVYPTSQENAFIKKLIPKKN